MKFYQVTFLLKPCNEDACDVLSSCLADIGFEAFEYLPEGLRAFIQQPLLDEETLKHITDDFIFPNISVHYHIEESPDEDWNQVWEEEGFEPIVLDDWVCVHDTKHTEVPACRYDIIINPRLAFGTGTHPTTQQILRQLCTMKMEGLHVVDAGCGTGVLGFLCLKRGAKEVFAYDIDEWSVENTRINAQLNGIQNIIVKEGDSGVLPQTADYDLLIANINRNTLLADMGRFAHTLKAGGRLLLSGFYEEDVPLLVEKGKEMGFRLQKQSAQDGWAIVVLNKDKR